MTAISVAATAWEMFDRGTPLYWCNFQRQNQLQRSYHGHPKAWTRGGGALAPSGNVVKCFVHCQTTAALAPSGNVVKYYVHYKTPSGRIINALFSQYVVGFWGLCPLTPSGTPPLDPAGRLLYRTCNLPKPGKNSAGAQGSYFPSFGTCCLELTSWNRRLL